MYDALANPDLLKECRPDAELIDAGTRARDHHLSQWQTNELLVKYAQEGKNVVRRPVPLRARRGGGGGAQEGGGGGPRGPRRLVVHIGP